MAVSKVALMPLLALVAQTSAWGSLGHTTVAFIAQNFVCDKAAQMAQRILNDTSANYLANVATWADSYRNEPEGAFSSHLHYIDALDNPPESCNVVFERDCPEDGCIVSAIANYSTRVTQKEVGIVEQQKALKWIIHFSGDIHQPLHVENLEVGGNLINVTFDGAPFNLHRIWDTNIPEKLIGPFSQDTARNWAANLTKDIKKGKYAKEAKGWLKGLDINDPLETAMLWAIDSNAYVCSTVVPEGAEGVRNQELGGEYYEKAIPVVQKQIAKAGYRLAALLDAIAKQGAGHPHKGKGGKNGWSRAAEKRDFDFEPWMEEAKQKRKDFGYDCGCNEEAHEH